MEGARSGRFSTTQSSVLTLWAVANYVKTVEDEELAIKIKAELGQSELFSTGFQSRLQAPISASVPLAATAGADKLAFQAVGTGNVWSTVKLTSAPKEANLEPELASGLIVSRTYSVVRPTLSEPGQTSFKRGQVVKVDLLLMTPEDRDDLVLEDLVPAGFEPVNFNLLSEDATILPLMTTKGEEDGSYRTGAWWDHQQIWTDRVAVFARYLPAGVYSYSYLVRPATPGVYRLPGPKAEAMYEPETFGRGTGHVIEVSD